MKTIVFFNNKGGVGKTSLAYHVSWMLRELEYSVLSVDLDPQANLTGMFMEASELERVFKEKKTLFYALEPLFRGTGDIKEIEPYDEPDFCLQLLPGDLNLSSMEGEFSDSWPKCLDKDERAFRVTTAFYRLIQKAGKAMRADWAVIDMGAQSGSHQPGGFDCRRLCGFSPGAGSFFPPGAEKRGHVSQQMERGMGGAQAKSPGNGA